jgi:hypothetical protein
MIYIIAYYWYNVFQYCHHKSICLFQELNHPMITWDHVNYCTTAILLLGHSHQRPPLLLGHSHQRPPLIRPLPSKATPLIRPLPSKATLLMRSDFRCTYNITKLSPSRETIHHISISLQKRWPYKRWTIVLQN